MNPYVINIRRESGNMITYKLFRMKQGRLYPLYVEANREMKIGEWISAQVGELVDDTHVKANGCGGRLSLRPGMHSTTVPYTDWIGKRDKDGTLIQRKDTVWCECEVAGKEIKVTERNGLRYIPDGYYFYKTNARQKEPWIISNKLKIKRILTDDEVKAICEAKGLTAQRKEI